MPTLAAGSSVTVSLGAYDSVTIECPSGGSCLVEVPAGTRVAEVSGARTFGPYPRGASVKMTASGRGIRYETQDGAQIPQLSTTDVAALQSVASGDGSADLLAFLANANDNGSRYIATDYVAPGYVF